MLQNCWLYNPNRINCFDDVGLVVRVPGHRCRGSGFDSLRYQISGEVEGLERDPLGLVRIIKELLGRNSGGSGL
jgi:hypothetical protein